MVLHSAAPFKLPMWHGGDAAEAVGVVCAGLGLFDGVLVDFEAIALVAAEALHVDVRRLL